MMREQRDEVEEGGRVRAEGKYRSKRQESRVEGTNQVSPISSL